MAIKPDYYTNAFEEAKNSANARVSAARTAANTATPIKPIVNDTTLKTGRLSKLAKGLASPIGVSTQIASDVLNNPMVAQGRDDAIKGLIQKAGLTPPTSTGANQYTSLVPKTAQASTQSPLPTPSLSQLSQPQTQPEQSYISGGLQPAVASAVQSPISRQDVTSDQQAFDLQGLNQSKHIPTGNGGFKSDYDPVQQIHRPDRMVGNTVINTPGDRVFKESSEGNLRLKNDGLGTDTKVTYDNPGNLQMIGGGSPYATQERKFVPASTEQRYDLGGGNYIGDKNARSAESVGKMRDIVSNAMSMDRNDPRRQTMAQTTSVQVPQLAPQFQQAPDYAGAIEDTLYQLQNAAGGRGFDEMIANKHKRKTLEAQLAVLQGQQKQGDDVAYGNNKLSLEQQQAQQKALFDQQRASADDFQNQLRNGLDLAQFGYGVERDKAANLSATEKAKEESTYKNRMLALEESKINQPKPITTNTYQDGVINGQNVGVVRYDAQGNPVYQQLGGPNKVAFPEGTTRKSLIEEANAMIKKNPARKSEIEADLNEYLKQVQN